MSDIHNGFYWWCKKCKDNVDVMIAHEVGIFCIICGEKVIKPKNRKGPGKFYVSDEDVDRVMQKW